MKAEIKKATPQKIAFEDNDFKIRVLDNTSEFVDKAYHEEVEIKYYYEGESAVSIGSEIIMAKAGDITVANPYEVHSSIKLKNCEGRYRLIILNPDFLTQSNRDGIDLRRIFIGEEKQFCNHIQGNERLGAIIKRIGDELKTKSKYYKIVVQSLVNEFFALMLRDYVKTDKEQRFTNADMKRMKLIAPALSEIHLSYTKKLTVDYLADVCNVSKYHFCRVFKEVMGITPVQYITKYRIDVAEVMLKRRLGSISGIAWQCGFEDESYFYRCYKRIKGVVPGKVIKE
ncbi:MAG: helix-turn-helix transcriptional regulator [Clostridia bacterium]|nr:helix-turn-helix transcriptional regulator [Clostridia bacterium]